MYSAEVHTISGYGIGTWLIGGIGCATTWEYLHAMRLHCPRKKSWQTCHRNKVEKYLLRVRKCQMWESVRNRRCSCSKYRENCSQLYFDRQFIAIIIIHKFQWGTLTIATSSTDEWCKNRHSFADLEHFPRVKSLQICWSFIKKIGKLAIQNVICRPDYCYKIDKSA